MLIDDLLNLIDHESTVFSLCLQGDQFKQALSALMKKITPIFRKQTI